jgi:hypothetical protein
VIKCVKIAQITDPLESNNELQRKYSPEDGPHDGPKHVVSEWKEMIIIKNFVAIDGHYNKVLHTEMFIRAFYDHT